MLRLLLTDTMLLLVSLPITRPPSVAAFLMVRPRVPVTPAVLTPTQSAPLSAPCRLKVWPKLSSHGRMVNTPVVLTVVREVLV